MAAILSIGEDAFLLETRAAVLRRTGAEIVNSNIASALSYLETRCFDLVILCHSIPVHLCRTLAQIIQLNWPATRLMHLSTVRNWEQSDIQPGVDICAPEPEQLLEHSIMLLGHRSPTGIKTPVHIIPIRTNFIH